MLGARKPSKPECEECEEEERKLDLSIAPGLATTVKDFAKV